MIVLQFKQFTSLVEEDVHESFFSLGTFPIKKTFKFLNLSHLKFIKRGLSETLGIFKSEQNI